MVIFMMVYLIVDVFKLGDICINQVFMIFVSDGLEIVKIVLFEGNWVDVNFSQVLMYVCQVVIVVEDCNFYLNLGFLFIGFVWVVKNNLFGGDLQGGLMIIQQYVKNVLVGFVQYGWSGLMCKVKELVIVMKMLGEWFKDDVLQVYLNIIYFGWGVYGILVVFKVYFDKFVEQLIVVEGVLLVVLIWWFLMLDLVVDFEGVYVCWNWVFDGMVEIKVFLLNDCVVQVFFEIVLFDLVWVENQIKGFNGLIEWQVIRELFELFNIDEQIFNIQGLVVIIMIDLQV